MQSVRSHVGGGARSSGRKGEGPIIRSFMWKQPKAVVGGSQFKYQNNETRGQLRGQNPKRVCKYSPKRAEISYH